MVLLEEDYKCVGPGWETTLKALDQSITIILGNSENRCRVQINQVKEKVGGLRFYYEPVGLDKEQKARLWGAVLMAECLSFKTCEACGSTEDVTNETSRKARKEGRMGGGRTLSLCNKCHQRRADEGGLEFGRFKV